MLCQPITTCVPPIVQLRTAVQSKGQFARDNGVDASVVGHRDADKAIGGDRFDYPDRRSIR